MSNEIVKYSFQRQAGPTQIF